MITPLEKIWLETRGGRTAKDVFINRGKKCTLMYDGKLKRGRFVKIPDEETIHNILSCNSWTYKLLLKRLA